MTLGQKIKRARTNAGLTQKQLAEQIEVKHNSISNWENDQNKPSDDIIYRIAQATGVPVEEISHNVVSLDEGNQLKGNKIIVNIEGTFGKLRFDDEIKVYNDLSFGPRVIAREYRLTFTDHDGDPDEITVIIPGDMEPVHFDPGTEIELKNPRMVLNVRQKGKVSLIHQTLYADQITSAGTQGQ